MDERVLKAALAGLLHDVGKIAQRGGERGSLDAKNAVQTYGYFHAMLTDDFLHAVLQLDDEIRLPAANHHIPQRRADWLVKAADVLSAGERADPPSGEDTKSAQPRQLLSIFSVVEADHISWKDNRENWRFLPLKQFALSEGSLFPGEPLEDDKVWNIYADLWRDFKRDAGNLTLLKSLDAYLEGMLDLLQKFAWCMPSAYYRARPDVSLYDHSRMTGALAAVMADPDQFPQDRLEKIARNPENIQDEVALLVGGDISGVQDFIYTITNKGAASSLRGRSFYIQLLTEAAARFTLRELELPVTNLIYAGGGNFYILARASDQARLATLRQKLSRILHRSHQGGLYVAIQGCTLKAGDFMRPHSKAERHPLSAKWGELAHQIAKIKNRRYTELDANELAVLFAPQGHGGNEDQQCQVCGREHPEVSLQDREVRKCPACLAFEELGKDLRDAHYISWTWGEHPQNTAPITPSDGSPDWKATMQELGFSVEVLSGMDEIPQDSDLVWELGSSRASQNGQPLNNPPVTIRRLLVNVTPRLEKTYTSEDGQAFQVGDIKPFEKLAGDSQGIDRLGVLRADVDNLGKLFAEGLGRDATLSRIASLSFSISLFFEGWVGHIAEAWNKEHDNVLYAIYSGGDDLFFVGAWDALAGFAWQVREDLKRYTGDHPGIHLSGGLILADSKYPLAKAAEDASAAENAAKSLAWWSEEERPKRKNAFTFLGQPLPWEVFGQTRALKARLQALEDNKRTAVIRKLLANYGLYAEAQEKRRQSGKDRTSSGKPQTLYGPWNWRIAYLLKRNLDKDNKAHQELVNNFHPAPEGSASVPDYARLEWVGVAARWVELEDRKEK